MSEPEQPENTFVQEEQARETIIVTQTVEVIEQVTSESEPVVEEEQDRTLLIVIPAAILSLILIVAIIMFVRFLCNRKAQQEKLSHAIDMVKTEAIKVEPQFVLEADDQKNIFSQIGSKDDE